MAPTLPVQAGAHEAVGTFMIEGGNTSPSFKVKYLRFGVWHHFQYFSPTGCLRDYVESIGLDYHADIVWEHVRSQDPSVDLKVGEDIDPRFNRATQIDVIVSYKRHGITHSFGFQAARDGYAWLEGYVKLIGLTMSDIKIEVLKSPVTA